jgi:transposase
MPVAGLDIHRKVVQAAVLDDRGDLIHSGRFGATREELERFARRHLGPEYQVALEATINTWAVARVLKPWVAEVVISNPLRTRAIAEAKIKTDRVDALVLAQLLRADYLPRVWQPDEDTRELRQQTTERAALVSDRTRLKNRVHAVLHQRLIHSPHADLFGRPGRAWLDQLELDPAGRRAIDSHLRQLDLIGSEQEQLQRVLAASAWRDPQVRLLMTLPGVDVAVAQAVLAALGDVGRFSSADRAAAYLGLVPSTRQSAEHCYHGPITKQGRGHARWLLVQAAQHLGTHPGPLGVFFRRLTKRKNRNVAVVATARKLVTIAWHMLHNNEPYRYAQPRSTESKLARLRVQATGKRKQGGVARGTPRPAHYGQKLGRPVPSLDAVYAGERLPPIRDPAPGEQRMIADQALTHFVDPLHQPARTPKKSGGAAS